jgi:DUF917 family protein
MKTDDEIIKKVVDENDMKALEQGTIEDVERFVYTIVAESLIEQGDLEDVHE